MSPTTGSISTRGDVVGDRVGHQQGAGGVQAQLQHPLRLPARPALRGGPAGGARPTQALGAAAPHEDPGAATAGEDRGAEGVPSGLLPAGLVDVGAVDEGVVQRLSGPVVAAAGQPWQGRKQALDLCGVRAEVGLGQGRARREHRAPGAQQGLVLASRQNRLRVGARDRIAHGLQPPDGHSGLEGQVGRLTAQVVGEQRLHGVEGGEHLADQGAVRAERVVTGLRDRAGADPGVREPGEVRVADVRQLRQHAEHLGQVGVLGKRADPRGPASHVRSCRVLTPGSVFDSRARDRSSFRRKGSERTMPG